ncbi:NAD kinase [Spongiivirga citrea]|uniref:NAD kinase n=1 Tax=Spongiivirga citrea TaxID=1481457 RepID=A0A6M0CQI4_9FLAO|nr:NAD kinase [Spongiivirga citrea]NER18139.1 NAD kinase [Spongiivirga citrea]
MKVAIYGQSYRNNSGKYVKLLINTLLENGVELIIEQDFYTIIKEEVGLPEELATFSASDKVDPSFDLLFSVGGDGTLLRTITYVRNSGLPIIGINTGRLGFLATIQKDKIEESITDLVNGNYKIVERSLLKLSASPAIDDFDVLDFALNEIVVSRKNTTSMITVETYLNDEYLTNYWADGLIVATPTGSTGYSLSCAGPVIAPNAKSFVLTPIAPHNLNARPLVIPDNTEIRLRVSGREDTYLVSLDSRIATVPNNTDLIISRAPFNINLIELADQSFLKTLRNKLLWGEDKRN